MTPRARHTAAAWWLGICLALIYIPDIGTGFIKDDYGWIASSHVARLGDSTRFLVETPMGFYRPLVSLSFAISERLHGARPLPYAHANFGFVVFIAVGLWYLARRLGLSRGAALFAAAVWAFNFHGINMSVLWISGRTSLLGTLGAVLAGYAFASSRFVVAGLCLLLALLAKEEPLLLPVALALWLWIDAPQRRLDGSATPASPYLRALWPSVAAVVVYLVLRSQTHAITPATAPDFYRLSLGAIGSNVVQYADRSLTFPLAVLLLGALGVSPAALQLTPAERRIVLKGGAWLALGFAVTIMVPVRSSLYVLLPSIGSALAAGAAGSALWRAMRRPRLMLALAMVLPLVLLPFYWARNVRMKNEGLLAAHTLSAIAERLATGPMPGRIVIVSPPTARPSIADAFGESVQSAVRLMVPAAASTDIVAVPDAGVIVAGDAGYVVRGTTIEAIDPPRPERP